MEVFAANRQRHAPSFTMPDFRTIIDAVISSHDHADIAQCGLLSDEAATNPTVARATQRPRASRRAVANRARTQKNPIPSWPTLEHAGSGIRKTAPSQESRQRKSDYGENPAATKPKPVITGDSQAQPIAKFARGHDREAPSQLEGKTKHFRLSDSGPRVRVGD